MKDKKIIILVLVVIALIVAIVYTKSDKKKNIDWSPTFYNTDTNPYGTYINYELLKNIFPEKKIRSTRLPVYNNLEKELENYYQYDNDYSNDYTYNDYDYSDGIETDSLTDTLNVSLVDDIDRLYSDISISDTTAYLFINTSFKIDKVDLEYLLDFVGLGNNVFISAEEFYEPLMDTLGIKDIKLFYGQNDSIYTLVDYPQKQYSYPSLYSETYFEVEKCKLPIRVLGRRNNGDPVFVQIQYGQGNIYLHTVPSAFSNLSLLKIDSYDYAFRCLSYIPSNSGIIWDEYQKQGAIGERSIFRVIYTSKPLTIAFIIILIGFILFMIFRAKRTQRIIPIIKPPVNSSIEFLETISNLYYRKKDFVTIINKRQIYLLDFIRKRYYMPTEVIDSVFIKNLSLKSTVDEKTITELFELYKYLRTLSYISNEEFLRYNNLLETFYKSAKNN